MEKVVRRQVSRISEGNVHRPAGAPHRQEPTARSGPGSYPRHHRNTRPSCTTTLLDILLGTATLPTMFQKNKHSPKWPKIPRELVIKILVFDVYTSIIIWGVVVVVGLVFFLI